MSLRQKLDSIKPTFSEGGKFHWLHSTFDAFESFMYVPSTVTRRGAHIRDCNDLKRTMSMVIIALLPALLFGMWNIGYQRVGGADFGIMANWWFGFIHMLPIILASYITGLGIEFASAQIKGEEVNEGFLVSGLLIPMILPVTTPVWMVVVATAFSVIFCKEVFGGTGMNVFNPAITARMFIFFSYTAAVSGDSVWYADAHSGATALTQLSDTGTLEIDMLDAFIGKIPGCIGETSTLCILIGAVILLWTGVASWRVMLSVFAGGLVMGLLFNILAPASPETPVQLYMTLPAWTHLLLGGFAFGAVFMATDPVTAAQTNTGKWIVGFLIGLLAVLMRVVNPGYPEGMMLAIFFMNALAPLVDHLVVEASIRRRIARSATK